MHRHSLHRLTIKHMQAMRALADTGSISGAARVLGVSQPALTSRLQEVERLSRANCFLRSGNRLIFTQAGMILLNSARLVLEELNRAESYLDHQDGPPVRTLRLETRGYHLEDHLAPVLARFMQDHPDTVVEVATSTDALPFESILDGRADVVVVLGDFGRDGVERHLLRTDALVGLVAPSHPLARKSHLSAADFAHETLLVTSATLERGQEVEKFFDPAGLLPRRVVAVGNAQVVCALVASGAGVGILGQWAASRAIRDYGLVALDLTPTGLTANWYAVRARSSRQDGAHDDLLAALKSGLG